MDWLLVEASDRLGGRLKTDFQDGFTLDHGFHVLQAKYPQLKGLINPKDLKCRPFASGAKVYHNARWHTIADAFRHPRHALGTLFSGLGKNGDILKLAWWSSALSRTKQERIWEGHEVTSLQFLKQKGFSEEFIDSFFRPFLGGVMLDPTLATSARQMNFAMKMFVEAAPVLPVGGIASIVPGLARGLPPERIRLSTEVTGREGGILTLKDGSTLKGFHIVIATEGPAAHRLLGVAQKAGQKSTTFPFLTGRGTTVIYFEAPAGTVLPGPWLLLNGEKGGPILHGCFPSQVQPSYAPAGRHLFAATLIGSAEPDLEAVRTQMADWFGEAARTWSHLRTIRIPHALPLRETLRPCFLTERLAEDLFICGDHRAYPSLNAALASGKRAAEAIIPETVF